MSLLNPPEVAVHLDQVDMLHAATLRLLEEFDATVGQDVIDLRTVAGLVHSSYEELAEHAHLTTYLPLMAERFARERLHALVLAKDDEHRTEPIVLFLCVHNAARSQMALGFFRRYAGQHAVGWSAGSEPAGRINPTAVAVMAEKGIDIGHEFPKPWTEEPMLAADVVVTMGCGDTCPVLPGKQYLDWELPDPDRLALEDIRAVRDQIEQNVFGLLSDLHVPVDR